LTWDMVTDAAGEVGRAIHLTNEASKGRSGRIIPLNAELRRALIEWRVEAQTKRASQYVIVTERSAKTSSHAVVLMFAKWYRALSLNG
jgi:integrase